MLRYHRLYTKDKFPVLKTDLNLTEYLIDDSTRTLLISSLMDVCTKTANSPGGSNNLWNTLWSTGNSNNTTTSALRVKRHIVLFSDLLVIAIPPTTITNRALHVESLTDLASLKISTPTSGHNSDQGDECILELLWPGGQISLICKSSEHREFWYNNLITACTTRTGFDRKFHLISPVQSEINSPTTTNPANNSKFPVQNAPISLHAAVIERNEQSVREYIKHIIQTNPTDIDDTDDDGYTALHYACILRLHNIIRLLYESNANIFYSDINGFTPLHWSAIQLDSAALDILLPLSQITDPDVYDHNSHTPLSLACIEGLNGFGRYDPADLMDTLDSFLQMRADPNIKDNNNISILQYISSQWKYNIIPILNTAGANVSFSSGEDGYQALHYAGTATPIFSLPLPQYNQMSPTATLSTSSVILVKETKNKILTKYCQNLTSENDTTTDVTTATSTVKPPSTNNRTNNRHTNTIRLALQHPMIGTMTIRALLRSGARPNAKSKDGRCILTIIMDNVMRWKHIHEVVCLLLIYGARITTDNMESNTIHILKERFKMEKKVLDQIHGSGHNSDPSDRDDDEEPAEWELINDSGTGSGDATDEDKNSNEYIRKQQDKEELRLLKTLSIEEAGEIWADKGDINGDVIGLRYV